MILMTGLSGSGKSTLAGALLVKLTAMGIPAEIIDGDVYRKTVNKDLDFSAAGRRENISRLTALAHNKNIEGVLSIVAAINPFEDQRMELAQKFGAKIIWVRCDLSTLIRRDTKGLYHKALLPDGHPDKLGNLSGINDTYEIPQHPSLVIDTSEASIEDSAEQLVSYVVSIINTGKS